MESGATKIVVYDLVSENAKGVRSVGYVERMRNVRIRCTRILHSLGLQCTESVILVAPNRIDQIDEKIELVKNIYDAILREISQNSATNVARPVIRVLNITPDQKVAFSELAARRVRENVDLTIDRVSAIIESRDAYASSQDARKIVRSLRRIKKEWQRIKEYCVDLGIDMEAEIQYLIDMISEAISQLRGGSI